MSAKSYGSRFALLLMSLGVLASHSACSSESDDSSVPPGSAGSGQEAGPQGGAGGSSGAAGNSPQSGGSAGDAAGSGGSAGIDAGTGGASPDGGGDENPEAGVAACAVSPTPAIGQHTPDYEPLTACTCAPGDNPACHGLFQARVVAVSADGWHATLEIKKANDQQISSGLLYWVVVGDQETDCTLLESYVVRSQGTVSTTGLSFTLPDVPIWPDQASFESDSPGASKYIFVVTDGAGSTGVKTWFQRDPTVFTKQCTQ